MVEIKCGMGVGAVTGGFLSCKTAVGGGGGWSIGGELEGELLQAGQGVFTSLGLQSGK